MTNPPIDICQNQLEIVQAILRKHVPDQEVWAFGSRAKGTARQYSDLDLAVITDTPLPSTSSALWPKTSQTPICRSGSRSSTGQQHGTTSGVSSKRTGLLFNPD